MSNTTNWNDRIVGFERRPANSFLAHYANPRRHPNNQRDALRGSLDTLGWYDAVLENRQTNNLLDGHLRIEEALSKDEDMLVPVLIVDLSPEEELLALASHDFISSLANYDRATLDTLLQQVNTDDAALQSLLSELAESQGIVSFDETPQEAPEAQIDRAEELQQKWNVQRGDVWVVGNHRIMCGDSTSAEDVARLMGGECARLMVTDPPYGVDYDPEWRDSLDWQKSGTASGETIINDDSLDWLKAFDHYLPDVLYVWMSTSALIHVQSCLEKAGFECRYHIIWNKDLAPIGRGNYHWKHEPCLYMVRKGAGTNWQGARDQSTVWDIPTIHSFKNGHNREEWGLVGHGNQKPVECMERPIKNNSKFGEIIFDPFLGSGTTLVACQQTGRIGYGMELAEKYVAVALERLSQMGLTPQLESQE